MAMTSRLQRARANPVAEQRDHKELQTLLWDYYMSNGLYDDVTMMLRENSTWGEAMRPLRNPANRSVEFFCSKIMAGPLDAALPLVATKTGVIDAIKTIWRWSNFGATKQLLSRWFACLGDGYIKVAQKGDRPEDIRIFFQILDPRWVCDLEKDERGIITSIRINVPRETTEKGHTLLRWWTEVWTPTRMQIWESHEHADMPIDKLGKPDKDELNSLGFVPIVHAPFRDIGETYGMGCYVHALDKIDELSRMVTRDHAMMFRYNKPVWSVETDATGGGKDSFGRPKPPRMPDSGEIEIGDDTLLSMPVGSKLNSMVPDIDWSAYLATIQAMEMEIMRDLPELKYYTLSDNAQTSGVALRYMLGDAIDRVVESRGNMFAAIVRADQIALTMAQRAGLPGFETAKIGTYETGTFEHDIAETPVIPLSPKEQADTVDILVRSGVKRTLAMKRNGFSDEEIAEQEAHEAQAATDLKAQTVAAAKEAAQNKPPVSNEPTGGESDTENKPMPNSVMSEDV